MFYFSTGVVTYCKKCYCPVAAEEGLTGQHVSKHSGNTSVGWYDTPMELPKEYLMDLDGEGTDHNLDYQFIYNYLVLKN